MIKSEYLIDRLSRHRRSKKEGKFFRWLLREASAFLSASVDSVDAADMMVLDAVKNPSPASATSLPLSDDRNALLREHLIDAKPSFVGF
jgi:hypothetical protein